MSMTTEDTHPHEGEKLIHDAGDGIMTKEAAIRWLLDAEKTEDTFKSQWERSAQVFKGWMREGVQTLLDDPRSQLNVQGYIILGCLSDAVIHKRHGRCYKAFGIKKRLGIMESQEAFFVAQRCERELYDQGYLEGHLRNPKWSPPVSEFIASQKIRSDRGFRL